MDESGTDGAECSRKVASGRRVARAVNSLVNGRDLHETLLVSVLIYGVRQLWKEKERSI